MLFFFAGILALYLGYRLANASFPQNKFGKPIQFAGLALVLFGISSSCLVVIQPGETGVPVLFGKVQGETFSSGLHIVNPLVTVERFDIKTQNYTMSGVHDEGDKAGDDAISLANASSLALDAIGFTIANSPFTDPKPTASTSIQNNILIGDADNIINSSSGADLINIGNNSSIDIKGVTLNSFFESDVKVTSTISLDIFKNSLIGDAKSLKNSSSGNDVVGVGNNIESKLGKTTVGSYS